MKTVVCPGSFDPITNGHLDIIKRASGLFDHVDILVANNPCKDGFFTPEERCKLINVVLEDSGISNARVVLFSGLLVDYLKQNNITAVIKGLRAVSDFEYEFQMASTNHHLYPKCETVFLTTSPHNMYLSSSIVRQVGGFGGDISGFVPECIHNIIKERLEINLADKKEEWT